MHWSFNLRRSASVSKNRCAGVEDVLSPAAWGATLSVAVAAEVWRCVQGAIDVVPTPVVLGNGVDDGESGNHTAIVEFASVEQAVHERR